MSRTKRNWHDAKRRNKHKELVKRIKHANYHWLFAEGEQFHCFEPHEPDYVHQEKHIEAIRRKIEQRVNLFSGMRRLSTGKSTLKNDLRKIQREYNMYHDNVSDEFENTCSDVKKNYETWDYEY